MKILLDTHVFLWWDSEPEKLTPRVAELLADAGNEIFMSVVSAWEIQIKKQLGKLVLSVAVGELIEEQQQVNNLKILPVELNQILELDALPFLHKDPFDRLLIAQARIAGLTIASADPLFSKYEVDVIW